MGQKVAHGQARCTQWNICIQPANLFLDDDLRVKIGDFGTGDFYTVTRDRLCHSTQNLTVGSVVYMAPELLRSANERATSKVWRFHVVSLTSVPFNVRNCVVPPDRLRSKISFSRTCNIPYLISYIYRMTCQRLVTVHWLCVCLHGCTIVSALQQAFAQCKMFLEGALALTIMPVWSYLI